MKWSKASLLAVLFGPLGGAFATTVGWFFSNSEIGFLMSVGSGFVEGIIVGVIMIGLLTIYGLLAKKTDYEGMGIAGIVAFFVSGFSPAVLVHGYTDFMVMASFGCLFGALLGAKIMNQ